MQEILKVPDARHEFYELLTTKRPELKLDGTLPQPHSLYIPRLISNRLLVDPGLFTEDCVDVFVFKGVARKALVELVHPHITRSSSTQLNLVSSRHIYLDDDEDWDDMILAAKVPIHMVLKEGEHFVLLRTTQVTDVLRSHSTNNKSTNKDAYISEEQLAIQVLSESKFNGALICDVPGMGKTWLMENLSRILQGMSVNLLVLFIQLSSFSKSLRDDNGVPFQTDPIKHVFKSVYSSTRFPSTLLHTLLEQQCRGSSISLVVLLDGFDEIRDDYVDRTTKFIQKLNNKQNIRVIISSRPHMRRHLEQTFGIVSYDMLPFAIEDQVKAMAGHWLQKWPSRNPKILHELALKCVAPINKLQHHIRQNILGVPLKCYILAVLNESHVAHIGSLHRLLKFNELPGMEPVTELYERFFEISLAKIQPDDAASDLKRMISAFHKLKALELLFPEVAVAYKSMIHLEPCTELIVQKAGIMFSRNNSDLEFVHRSFAEFFVGKFFAEFWMNIEQYEQQFVDNVGSYFFENVLRFTNRVNSDWIEIIKLNRTYMTKYKNTEKIVEFKSSHMWRVVVHE